MLSLPLNTVTPSARKSATGGKFRAPGAFVMIETPLFAMRPPSRLAASGARSPSA